MVFLAQTGGGVDVERVTQLVDVVADRLGAGSQVILVSSGAIATGEATTMIVVVEDAVSGGTVGVEPWRVSGMLLLELAWKWSSIRPIS